MMGNEYLFTNIGIDSIGFHAPKLYVDLEELAIKRNVDPEKYKKATSISTLSELVSALIKASCIVFALLSIIAIV